jgi:mannose 2-epimerase
MVKQIIDDLSSYFREKLLPFWLNRVESPTGGFSTSYDKNGNPVPGAAKTLLCQARCIFSFSHLLRWGFIPPGKQTKQVREMLLRGIDYLNNHFKDDDNGGYNWICSEDGKVTDSNKIVYGHSFLIYAFAEFALAAGNKPAEEEAENLFALLEEKARDSKHGGYIEHFDTEWNPRTAMEGREEFHKSMDVHMHLMEAFTELVKLTGKTEHMNTLRNVTDLIFKKMIYPASEGSAGCAMFHRDWVPMDNVRLDTVWGSDRFGEGKKNPDITSYGHNVEFAWLYLKAADALNIRRDEAFTQAEPLFRHTLLRGVDTQYGGLYVEGERDGEAADTDKEFWQQAEALAGFSHAYRLTKDKLYLEGFEKVRRFVFDNLVHPELGEWFPLSDRQGNIKRDYLGHEWKTCYHTLRGVSLAIRNMEHI